MSCSKFLLRFNTESTRFRFSASHHNKRRVICQSSKSHFVSHRKAFYEAYSRAMQVIGWFLSDSGKHLVEWMRSRLIYPRLKSREVSFLTKLFSLRDTYGSFPYVEVLIISVYLLLHELSDLLCRVVYWFRRCFEKVPPNSDVLHFLFLFSPIYRPNCS